MLNRSLLISGQNGCQAVVKQRASLTTNSKLSNDQAKLLSSSSSTLYLLPGRFVSTTVASKANKLAHQAKQSENQQHDNLDTQTQLQSSKAQQQKSLISNEMREARLQHLELWHSVDQIKRLGHRMANLDPLNLKTPETLESVAWSHPMIEQMRANRDIVATNGFLDTKQPLMAVNELIEAVLSIYTGSDCGLEFGHLSNQEEIEWLTSNWEKLNEMFHLDSVEQQNLAKLLLECEAFDHFMAAKFPTTKRYGCEGAESMLVVFDEILRLCHLGAAEMDEMTCSIGSIDDVIIGLPHRGRLNLLTCLLGLEPAVVFNKTRGESELDLRAAWMAKGDVLSHLSTNMRFVYGIDRQHIGLSRDTPHPINVTLLPNPSHLEVSAPMVAGAARGRAHNLYHRYSSSPKFALLRQQQHANKLHNTRENSGNDYSKLAQTILPVQVHGDAALAGQGIIQETLQMSQLPMFSVGGSLHLVVNNQIGYTTEGSTSGRSSRYCTDILKLTEAPIIHVNGQNISGVIRATRLALAYRQRFGKDVAIDLVCYRQHGHNEIDEPTFTQPIMYDAIRRRQSIPQLYCDSIGLNQEERTQIVDGFRERLKDSTKQLDSLKADNDNYRNFSLPTEYHRDHVCSWKTGCDLSLLRSVALASVKTPKNFNVHPNLQRVLINERERKFGGENLLGANDDDEKLGQIKVDWATGEILALGSLLKQNNSVRLAGQDVARGTFSTRHAVLIDQKTGQPYIPLNNMFNNDNNNNNSHSLSTNSPMVGRREPLRPQLEVANTILSEEAAIAYEFAFSVETCNLTIWEAQFGDFFNTAQSVIDTLVSSSESKWLKQSPLTLLLPHGLDGAGPEHSSAHLERFLQMSSSSFDSIDTEAKVNWSICFPTLPSQYFHLLRRQVLRPFRKPLVVMSPKVIFRHPDCVSQLADFGPDKSFEPVLDDPMLVKDSKQSINTIVLCSGKVYFQLQAEKLKNNMDNVALIRIEELCPFPIQSLIQTIKQYPNVTANKFVWFQEEHKNQGAYSFVDTRFSNMAGIKLRYIGRPESELPATGISALHKKEHEKMMREFHSLRRI